MRFTLHGYQKCSVWNNDFNFSFLFFKKEEEEEDLNDKEVDDEDDEGEWWLKQNLSPNSVLHIKCIQYLNVKCISFCIKHLQSRVTIY